MGGCKFRQFELSTGRSGQVVWYVAFRPARHFVDDVELRSTDFLAGVQHPVRASNEWLFEINGVVDDADHGQQIAVTDEVLRHRRPVAVSDAIALNPTSLEMRAGDRQHVAFPNAGREAGPGVGGVRWRMGTAVQPDQPGRLSEGAE